MRIDRVLVNAQQAHAAITAAYQALKPYLLAGHEFALIVKPKTRSTAQNARMWSMLGEVSAQVVWHGRKLTPQEWKHVFSAALKRQDVVPGLDGGFVVLGQSTSNMTIAQMGELMELIEAFGAQNGVRFSCPEEMVC